MDQGILIVSGLPRSGTSLMMQMLENGGMEVVTDRIRSADTDNPRGYYEFEQVKTIQRDASWLPAMRGKAFKMVSQLLYDLPASETYRILFMERDLEETLLSQEKMLTRLGRTAAPREQMKQAYALHLERLHEWLSLQGNLAVLRIRYNNLVERPREQAERVAEFIGGKLDVEAMVKTVDLSLYRNRKTSGASGEANSA
jgi:Sulfotransferase domain